MTITVAIIGCGRIARHHLEGIERAGARVAWVSDLRPEAAADFAQRTGARVAADYRTALADPAVQAVCVTTITSAHQQVCLDAIAAGKAVICEKTLTEDPADSWAVVRAAETAGTPFFTNYMKRFLPAVEQAKTLLPSLGRIITTHVRCWQPWGDLWTEMPREGACHTPPGGMSELVRNNGGGVLLCGGSHVVDLMLHLVGRPSRVHAHVDVLPGRDYDVHAGALLTTANGPVHLSVVAHPHARFGYERDGWDERIEILGTRGRLEICCPFWDQGAHKASLLIHDAADGTRTEHRFAAGSPFARSVAAFCTAIAAGRQEPQSRLTGYEADEVLAAIARSGREDRTIAVPWRDAATMVGVV